MIEVLQQFHLPSNQGRIKKIQKGLAWSFACYIDIILLRIL